MNRQIKASLLMVLLIPMVFLVTSCSRLTRDVFPDTSVKAQKGRESFGDEANADRMFEEGERTFRDDTFGSEAFWGDKLKLHLAIIGEKQGGDWGRRRITSAILEILSSGREAIK